MKKYTWSIVSSSIVQFLSGLIILSSCNNDDTHYYHPVFYEDCVGGARISNATFLTKCVHRDTKHVAKTKRQSIEPDNLIPLDFDDDSDLEYLTQFSPTEFLDKLFGKRIFNTTMNVIVPMFHVTLPMHASSGSTLHLAMQATLGLFSLAAWAFTVIIPALFTYIIPFGYRSLSGTPTIVMSHFNHKKFNELSEKIGLDWDTCLQKTICEAHSYPKKYGVIATLFQMFFTSPSKIKEKNNSTFAHPNDINLGKHNTTSCEEKYRCFFDILDLGDYLINLGYYKFLDNNNI